MNKTCHLNNALLCLSPMAGYTDASFRLLCKEFGADVTTTEMISAKALCYDNARTKALLYMLPGEGQVSVQLFGKEPDIMAEGAQIALETLKDAVSAIDINMGCPAQKIVRNGEGSALMQSSALAESIVSAVVGAVSVPVTVKIRKGVDERHINAVAFAQRMADAGAAMLTVHGRTAKQQYGGRADWDIIRKVVESVEVPVIGNGDVVTCADAARMLNETGCAGIAVGRGALGKPWLFSELRANLSGLPYVSPTPEEMKALMLRHVELAIAEKGPRGIVELRKHIGLYISGTPGASRRRVLLQTAETVDEIREILT